MSVQWNISKMLYYFHKLTDLTMISLLMSLNYDILLQYIFVELTIFSYDLFQDVSFMTNPFVLTFTARKTIFPKSWDIMESFKRPSKYNLSINFLAGKKDRTSHHRQVQDKNFSVISKYHLSINFLGQKKTIFPIPKKFKTSSFH